jgi:beta-lactamase class D
MKTLIMLVVLFTVYSYSQKMEEAKELKKYFDEYGHEGCFVLYDFKNDSYLKYNPERCAEEFIPA